MSEIASAYVTLLPSFKGGQSAIEDELGPASDKAGKAAGSRFGKVWASATIAPIRSVGVAALGLFAADKVKDFLGDAISQASDLNESTTKLQEVFGSATGSVMKFADGGAKAFGQTKNAVLDAASTFGVYGRAAGLTGDANAKFSQQLVGLSTDLASFYNTDPSQAVEAIAAGLRGESEPLRQYGVLLDDATLRQQAFQMGLIKTTKNALTPQQRALAAQAVIMKQTKVAQGDFARTSGGLANQQRILAAQWGNFKTTLGGYLLPIMVKLTTLMNTVLFPVLGKVMSGVTGLFGALSKSGPVKAAIGMLSKLSGGASGLLDLVLKGNFTHGLGQALGIEEDSPLVGKVLDVRDAVKGLFGTLSKSNAAGKVFADLKGGLSSLGKGLPSNSPLSAALGQLGGEFKSLVPFIGQVMDKLAGIGDAAKRLGAVLLPIATQIVQAFIAKWGEIGPKISAVFAAFVGVISAYIELAKAIILAVLNVIRIEIEVWTAIIAYIWQHFGATIVQFVTSAFSSVLTIIQGVLTIVRGVIQTITALIHGDWAGVWNGIKTILSGVWTAIQGIVSLGLAALRALMAAAWTALKLGVSAAWSGIKAAVSAGVSGIVAEIKALPGQIMALGGLMLRAGSSLMGKLFEGLKSAAGSAGGFAVDIAGAIVDNVKDFLNGVLPHSIGIHKGPINLDVPLFPMLAKGGPLGGGSPAIVGERGPELFVPDVPGRVMTATATRRILSAQQGTGAMPSTLVVVDADGALIGRMQVEANSVVQGQARSVALAGKR